MSDRPADPAQRLFVSIPLPGTVRDGIAGVAESLRPHGDGIRWGSSDRYHITLRFLGDVAASRVDAVADALRLGVRGLPPFSFELSGAGAFPSLRRASVVWVGADATAELSCLHDRVEAALTGVGFERDPRPFSPHVTIGRIRRGARPSGSLADSLAAVRIDATVPVEAIALVRSRLSPSGARHENVAVCPLEGG